MGVRKRLDIEKQVKDVVIFRYCLESEKQKCLKAGYVAIKYKWQDKAKEKICDMITRENKKGNISK